MSGEGLFRMDEYLTVFHSHRLVDEQVSIDQHGIGNYFIL